LDIVEVARLHTGAVLANKFTKVLEEFGVADKGSDVSEDYEMIDVIGGDFDNDDIDGGVDEDTLMSVNNWADLERNICPVRTALAKIRKMAFKIINSPTLLLPVWDAACREAGLVVRRIPRDVPTCWNSSFNMASFVVDYCIPVDAMADKQRLGLGDYALDEHEWKVLEQLQNVLVVLKDATLFFSRGTPNLAMVIPAMDYIDKVFTTGMLNQQQFNPAIRSALGHAKNTLNKYYSLTDSSKVYRVVMGKQFIR
ncbi:hypothetical protein SCLCIDRAFT_105430, partial [Scleroderma citrinum Foug A]